MQPHICSYIYLVFENITIFLRCESLNHCITCTELTPSCCAHNQKEFCDFKNVPCECSSLRLIQIACGLFYWQNKNALLILPVLHKFYWQNKQSLFRQFQPIKRVNGFSVQAIAVAQWANHCATVRATRARFPWRSYLTDLPTSSLCRLTQPSIPPRSE